MNESREGTLSKPIEQPAPEIVGMRNGYGGVFFNACPADEDDARAVWFPPRTQSKETDASNGEYQTLAVLDTEPYLKFGPLAVESIAIKHHVDKDHLLLEIRRKSGKSQLISLAYTEKGDLTMIAYAVSANPAQVFDTEEIGILKLE